MSFGFGSQAITTTGTAFGFGAKPSTPSFGLGTATTTSSLFGTPQQANATSGITFGTPGATQNTGLFGTATTTQASGLTFGTPTTQASGLTFGAQATTGLSFGTPTTQQSQPTAASTLPFGTPASSAQPTINFGTPTTTTQTGLTFGSAALFGTPSSSAPAQFGTPATTSQPTLAFTTLTTTAAPIPLSFGSQVTTSAAPTPAFGSGGFAFGASSTTASAAAPGTTAGIGTLAAAATTATAGTAFGTPATQSQPFGSSLLATPTSSNLFSTPTTTSTSLGFSIGTATSKPGGLFATAATATTTSGLTLPAFGSTAAASSSLFTSFTKPTTSTATTTSSAPSIGLGGLDTTQSKGLASSITGASVNRGESKTVKETVVPNELLQTVDSFKDFVKKQKAYCSDVARSSPKTMHKVQEDLELLKQMVASEVSDLQRNVTLSSRLKADTDKCLQTVEMAQKTQDTPPGLQFENTAPDKYFEDLVTRFENQIQVYKQEVDKIEAHVNAVLSPKPLSSQEFCLALKRLLDCFVAVAGRLHEVHNMVENQKEQYLNLLKYFLKDTTNVFEEDNKKSSDATKTKSPTISTGPTAFSALGNQGFGLISSLLSKAQLPSSNPLGWGSNQQQSSSLQLQYPQQQFFSSGSTLLSGGITSNINALSTPQPVENQSFQLQKPPVGNKRGKRI
ncbi:nuclear pore complex protein Nup58-like [Schistocerca gregaria]|uniref:nuclear pore complex protein Nup58-like n=1 Tax=Schistocerca gregaria TaxID=7010 RepID=UPI00211DF5E5|nr:nuclear pore complex protein Nup58-like [Schistocerca gregaria]